MSLILSVIGLGRNILDVRHGRQIRQPRRKCEAHCDAQNPASVTPTSLLVDCSTRMHESSRVVHLPHAFSLTTTAVAASSLIKPCIAAFGTSYAYASDARRACGGCAELCRVTLENFSGVLDAVNDAYAYVVCPREFHAYNLFWHAQLRRRAPGFATDLGSDHYAPATCASAERSCAQFHRVADTPRARLDQKVGCR